MNSFPANDIESLTQVTPRYDLAESVGPNLRLHELLGGAADAFADPALRDLELGYGTAQGNAQLRGLVAQAYGVDPDDVLITVGGMHALFLIAFALCGRDAEAVTTSPLFPLARNVLEAVETNVRVLRLTFDDRYQPDVRRLGELLSQQTRLVSLASPQNPSGVAIRAHTLREILALMARKCPQAYLLIDETYRDAAYGDDEIASSAVNLGPRVISTASLSKCHGAAGLRLGWAITPDTQLREQLVRGKFNTIISCSQVDEALAIRVLQQRERILDNRRRHLVEGLRRTELWAQQNSTHVDWVRPDAGALCCVRLKESGFDTARVERFYSALEDAGVRVANGEWFGEESRVFRLGFGLLPMHELEAALELLSRVLGQTASGQDESRRVS